MTDSQQTAAPVARLAQVALVVCLVAVGISLSGPWWSPRLLGTSDDHVEGTIRSAFAAWFDATNHAAAVLAASPSVLPALGGDTANLERAFADAARVWPVAAGALPRHLRPGTVGLTLLATNGGAVVWSGQPSETPSAQWSGPGGWFLDRRERDVRLSHVLPVADAGGVRRGTVIAELSLPLEPDRNGTPRQAIRLPGVAAPVLLDTAEPGEHRPSGDTGTVLRTPAGTPLLTAIVSQDDTEAAQRLQRTAIASATWITVGLGMLLLLAPWLDWCDRAVTRRRVWLGMLVSAGLILVARACLRLASPADWTDGPLFSAAVYAGAAPGSILTSPFDFLATALTVAGLLLLAFRTQERLAMIPGPRKSPLPGVVAWVAPVGAGLALAGLFAGYRVFLADTVSSTTLDLLHFSFHPWDSARVALQVGLAVWHLAVVGAGVLILRLIPAVSSRSKGAAATRLAGWLGPVVLWSLLTPDSPDAPALLVLAALTAWLAARLPSLHGRFQRGSEAYRLLALSLLFIVPALAAYPAVVQLAWRAEAQRMEHRLAPQILNQRERLKQTLQASLGQIDALMALPDFSAPPRDADRATSDTDRAFAVWRTTALASPITSSVELYDATGALSSRYAFSLPEDLSGGRRRLEPSCEWDVYEEVSPFFAEERRILHAGRALCDASGRPAGSIVVHAMLGYADLPFISSQSPYVDTFGQDHTGRAEGESGRNIELAVYGWSRTPLYSSESSAWPLPDDVFARASASREAFWARLTRDGTSFNALMLNDRGALYALAAPAVSPFDHLVNLAEVVVLGGATFALWSLLGLPLTALRRRPSTIQALIREFRASFARTLFLAVVAAAILPVATLALVTRTYMAAEIRAAIEAEAVRTVSSARRILEDLAAPRGPEPGYAVDDDLMVWVSRMIGEEVNLFAGPSLIATSERNLFASGLLPPRTPAAIYAELALHQRATAVARDALEGRPEYMVVGTPVTPGGTRAILTVPLALRQQQIDDEVDTLDRRVLLAVLLLVLAGGGMGYSMAERIADPVSRLTLATRRIARGEFDARLASTSSDELQRLVDAFNTMAADLERQQGELERTHRLEAWAEVARQVAHDIKNPLTPIQLNAEHLLRVDTDRGSPLGPVLRSSLDTILQQVALLRRIASEFSSFASAPTVRLAPMGLPVLVRDVLAPYQAGLAGRVTCVTDIPDHLPQVSVDRDLFSRALANLIENALQAMPDGGTLALSAAPTADGVALDVSDTGRGMDADAMDRAFEPYFSTKTTGTGLGLPIAKRNVELCGGHIAIVRAETTGTRIRLTLRIAGGEAPIRPETP